MKKKLFLLATCIFTCVYFMGCKEDPEILTKPVIVSGILGEDGKPVLAGDYDGKVPFEVKFIITGDFNLRSVKVETLIDNVATTVETVTSFPTPKDYTYVRGFEVPDGKLLMSVRITAENEKGLSTTVVFILNSTIKIEAQDVVDVMAGAYTTWEETGSLPESYTLKGTTLSKEQMYDYLCQTFAILNGGQNTQLLLNGYAPAENPDLDDFTTAEVSIHMMANQTQRQMTYASNNGIWANYVGYGSYQGEPYIDPDGTPHEGRFSFNRAMVCFARIFAAYKANGVLPAKVSSTLRQVNFQTLFIDAYSEAYKQFAQIGRAHV